MQFSKITILAVTFLASVAAFGQQHPTPGTDLGNAGDPIRELFHAARNIAVDIVESIDPESVSPNQKGPDNFKILDNGQLSKLKQDLRYTLFIWHRQQTGSCAATKAEPYAELNLSFANCRGKTLSEAVNIVLAASVKHLFSSDDEAMIVSRILAVFKNRFPGFSYQLLRGTAHPARLAVSVQQLAGTYKRSANDEDEYLIDEFGGLSWPLRSSIDGREFNLVVSQFLERDADLKSFHVKGVIQIPSRQENGLTAMCQIPADLHVTPSPDLRELHVEVSRPAQVSDRCETSGQSILSFSLTKVEKEP